MGIKSKEVGMNITSFRGGSFMKNKVLAGILILGLVLVSGCGTVKNHTNGDRNPLVQYVPEPPEGSFPAEAEPGLLSITVFTKPTKLNYLPGDTLDIEGITVLGTFDGEASPRPVQINLANCSPIIIDAIGSTAGEIVPVTIQVKVGTKIATFNVQGVYYVNENGRWQINGQGIYLDAATKPLLPLKNADFYNFSTDTSNTPAIKFKDISLFDIIIQNSKHTRSGTSSSAAGLDITNSSLISVNISDISSTGANGVNIQNSNLNSVSFTNVTGTTSSGTFSGINITGISILQNVFFTNIAGSSTRTEYRNVRIAAGSTLKDISFNNVKKIELPALGSANTKYEGTITFAGDCTSDAGTSISSKTLTYNNAGGLTHIDGVSYTGSPAVNQYGEVVL